MPRICLVFSIASLSLALPGLERWERPTRAAIRASGVQPGRLAQGPDEKKGRAGRTAGCFTSVIEFIPSRMIAPRWGGVARRRYRGRTLGGQPLFGNSVERAAFYELQRFTGT